MNASRTQFLTVLAVAAVLMQVLPAYSGVIKWGAIGLGILYLVLRASLTYPRQYRLRRQLAEQRAADEREYAEYSKELKMIYARYAEDPHDGASGVATPGVATPGVESGQSMQAEIDALHQRHHDMLKRKFGTA